MTGRPEQGAIDILLSRIAELAAEGNGMDAEEVAAQARLLGPTPLVQRLLMMAGDSRLAEWQRRTARDALEQVMQ